MSNRKFVNPHQNHHPFLQNFHSDSFHISHSKPSRSFLQDNLREISLASVSSPIMKMKADLNSPMMSRQDILNYSSNTCIQQPSTHAYKSSSNSPSKENRQFNTRLNHFAAKKYSIPEMNFGSEQAFQRKKLQENWQENRQNNQLAKPLRKLNGKRASIRQDNEEENKGTELANFQPARYVHSQKLIDQPSNYHKTETFPSSYTNYHQLQEQLQKTKQDNTRLKLSKEQLMQENLQIKRQTSTQIRQYELEIESLKEHIYRMEMDRQSQQPMTGRSNMDVQKLGVSRNGTTVSGRWGDGPQQSDANLNAFYVEQLEKQNQQLVRENRRLNDIIMKRLKHSVAD